MAFGTYLESDEQRQVSPVGEYATPEGFLLLLLCSFVHDPYQSLGIQYLKHDLVHAQVAYHRYLTFKPALKLLLSELRLPVHSRRCGGLELTFF